MKLSLHAFLLLMFPLLHSAQDLRLDRLVNATETIASQNISANGNWVALRKAYETNNDTVAIFSAQQFEMPALLKYPVRRYEFADDRILLQYRDDRAEIYDLKSGKASTFNNVSDLSFLPASGLAAVRYTAAEQNRIELYNSNMKLLYKGEHVTHIEEDAAGTLYLLARPFDAGSQISSFRNGKLTLLYTGNKDIVNIEVRPDGNGILCTLAENDLTGLLFIDTATKNSYYLPAPEGASAFVSTALSRNGDYFMTGYRNPAKSDGTVDIWYANDNNLSAKFGWQKRKSYLWRSNEHSLQQVGSDSLFETVHIGSDRFYLVFDPDRYQNYLTFKPEIELNVYDTYNNSTRRIGLVDQLFYASPMGRWLLFPRKEAWSIYNVETGESHQLSLPAKENGSNKPGRFELSRELPSPAVFTDENTCFIASGETLWKYDLKRRRLNRIKDFPGYDVVIENLDSRTLKGGYNFYSFTLPAGKSLILKLTDRHSFKTSYILWENGKMRSIVPPTTNKISFFTADVRAAVFSWTEENHNSYPEVKLRAGNTIKTLYKTNAGGQTLNIKQEVVQYRGPNNELLNGILYFPVAFQPGTKYPMVVHIYEKQFGSFCNIFLQPTWRNGTGFNIRLLLEKGYFVFLPDIAYGDEGPGLSALLSVNRALDAIENVPEIDKGRVGLIGQSFGGYETNFIATRSDRFAAFVSGAAHADIVYNYFTINNNSHAPEFWRYEDYQYRMGTSFTADKEKYFENNPIYNTEIVKRPMLLWTGKKDENVPWMHTLTMYNALRRNGKQVIALLYPREGHSLMQPKEQRDLTQKVLDWFDCYLTDNKDIRWLQER